MFMLIRSITGVFVFFFILCLHKDWEKSGRSVGKVSIALVAEEGSWDQSSQNSQGHATQAGGRGEPLSTLSCRGFFKFNETGRSSIRALWPRS